MIPDIIFPNLGITFNTVNRAAFTIFGLEIYWYAIFVVLGIAAGVFFGGYFAPKKSGQNPDIYLDYAPIAIALCIIGARIFYIIFSWDSFSGNILSIFNLRQGGLAIYGVVITAVLSAFVYTRIKKIDFLNFVDTGIVGLIIGHAIGRLGNFVNREAFGSYTNSIFAMQIRIDQIWGTSLISPEMLVEMNGIQYVQVHPTFLYEILILTALFIFLNIYRNHKKFNGELTAYYFLTYGIARFFIEGLRRDQLLAGNLPVSQLVSALLVVIGAAILIVGFVRLKRDKKPS